MVISVRSFLHILSDAIATGRCQAMVIGGYALEAYGFQRPTHDIDLLVTVRETEAVQALLAQSGYLETGRNELCARFAHSDPMLFPVDLLFVKDATWDKMWPVSEPATIEGASLRVAAPAHTVALKLHAMRNDPAGRKNDFGDIVRVLIHRPDALTMEELKHLCARYAPEGIFERLLNAIRHER